jgi:hypothetical protein
MRLRREAGRRRKRKEEEKEEEEEEGGGTGKESRGVTILSGLPYHSQAHKTPQSPRV